MAGEASWEFPGESSSNCEAWRCSHRRVGVGDPPWRGTGLLGIDISVPWPWYGTLSGTIDH